MKDRAIVCNASVASTRRFIGGQDDQLPWHQAPQHPSHKWTGTISLKTNHSVILLAGGCLVNLGCATVTRLSWCNSFTNQTLAQMELFNNHYEKQGVPPAQEIDEGVPAFAENWACISHSSVKSKPTISEWMSKVRSKLIFTDIKFKFASLCIINGTIGIIFAPFEVITLYIQNENILRTAMLLALMLTARTYTNVYAKGSAKAKTVSAKRIPLMAKSDTWPKPGSTSASVTLMARNYIGDKPCVIDFFCHLVRSIAKWLLPYLICRNWPALRL